MVELGTVISAVLEEITRARAAADAETVVLADAYARDRLMRHMPIPRFRLPEVTVDLPLVVDEVDNGGDTPKLPAVPSQKQRQSMLAAASRAAGTTLTRAEQETIHEGLTATAEKLNALPRTSLTRREITRHLQGAAIRGLSEVSQSRDKRISESESRAFEDAIGRILGDLIDAATHRASRMQVRARTQDVQSQPDPSRVMSLRLTISEEDYELTLGEADGSEVEYFGPE